jgi:hypothetical protein
MSTTLRKSSRSHIHTVLAIAVLIALIVGCNGVKFCCLKHEIGTQELTYCNSHSRAVGHLLLDAQEVSADSLNTALNRVERLAEDAEDCPTVDCIESMISGDPGLGTLWQKYQEEHFHVDSLLAADGVEFSESKKVHLISCGFTDAAQRTRENIK